MQQDAPDTPKGTTVHDHPFEPIDDVWWRLCRHCNLGRASHSMLCDPKFDPPFRRPPNDGRTDRDEPDDNDDENLLIVTNEDTMFDAQMHINPKDAECP